MNAQIGGKAKLQIVSAAMGLALMGSGCASLRPPTEDKIAREQQQMQATLNRTDLWFFQLLHDLWPVGWSPSP